MNDKHLFTLDVISSLDDDILDKNLKKRLELWFKKSKKKPIRWTAIAALAACVCILFSAVFWLLPGLDGKQVPVYRGMTVSNEAPVVEGEEIRSLLPYPSVTVLSASTNIAPYTIIPLAEENNEDGTPVAQDDEGQGNEGNNGNNGNEDNNGNGNNKDGDKHPKPGKDENDAPDIVFGETYYALKNEDIYIHIHLSNPDEFEILSFTLNGKKYSSNMFEYGSDLQTLILKYNVGEVDGLQEYTIDAIKYVDGEEIKDVRMEGDKTVRVFVNDEKDVLQFNASLSFTTLTIAPTRPLLSLALYEGNTKVCDLSTNDMTIEDLPFNKRLILKATYSDGTQVRTAQHVFDTQKLSEGLVIVDGVIRGMGTCMDNVLYINNPVSAEAFSGVKSIVKVYMGSGATSIGEKAFKDCSQLTTVVLSKSLKSIGVEAFGSCTALENITLPDSLETIGVSAFSACKVLKNVTIPDGIEVIEERTFASCTSLQTITLPKNLKSIGKDAFSSCTSLTGISLPNNLASIEEDAFYGCTALQSITFSDNLTSIGNNAFKKCTALQSITLPNNLTSIGNRAFSDCTSLTGVSLPANLTTIGEGAFRGCTSLTGVSLPANLTVIGDGAFQGCTSLTGISLPEKLTVLGNGAFRDCPLTWIDIPPELKISDLSAIDFHLCSLTSLTIPGGMKEVGWYFLCDSKMPLVEITLGHGVQYIRQAAFAHLSPFTKINLPSTIYSICFNAFVHKDPTEKVVVEYAGTIEDWNRVRILGFEDGFQGVPGSDAEESEREFFYSTISVIHCIDGDIIP